MAESITSIVAENVLAKLGSLAYQEVFLALGLKDDLRKLQNTLDTVKAVLLDAREQHGHSNQVRVWLENLKDVCYDAEDVLDEFEVELVRRRAMNGGSITRKVRNFFSYSNPLVFPFVMGHKIKEIREKLDDIATDKANFTLLEGNNNKPVRIKERETHSFVLPSEVIGRDEDKNEIIQLLKNPSVGKNLSVIPITGIGGLGKSTLAKLVYNDETVDEIFELKMWVCVSHEFDLKKFLIDIINSATRENITTNMNLDQLQRFLSITNMNLDQLQIILRHLLDNKKYLLVMDDVWLEDSKIWIEIKNILPGATNGSKIIVTTRSDQVASIMGTVPAYKLEGLSDDKCLSLLFKCAFKEGKEKHHLLGIAEEIVEKCGGVPLAVKTLGSLLYNSNDENDWKHVRDNDIWKLEQKENDILPVLKLSYHQLPSHLKPCFAYFSIFTKNLQFENLTLVQFWIAHGLLQSHEENQDLEKTGMRYLKELVSRSFLEFENSDDQHTPKFSHKFNMHVLMHELASLLMNKESLIVESGSQSLSNAVRHLAFVNTDKLEKDVPSNCHVRTLLFRYDTITFESLPSFVESLVPKFKFLRWLDIHASNSLKALPENIGNLKHLRFLCLGTNQIKKLPNSICKLHSLQTLLLGGCDELEELPRDIKYLISLKIFALCIKRERLLKNEIACMGSLRTLGIIGCDNLKYLFEDMDRLHDLETFSIRECPELISLPYKIKSLSKLENLRLIECESLNLSLSTGEDNLKGPPLRVLKIQEIPLLVELPQWLLQDTLQTLYVEDCSNFKALPESLQHLKSLQVLRLQNCPKLLSLPKNLTLESLQVLHIMDCPEFLSLPENINHLADLRELKIEGCPILTTKCQPEEGEDWPKIADIPTIDLDGEIIKSNIN